MTFHPHENRAVAPTRRQFLQLGALAAMAGSGVLAGCGRERPRPSPTDQITLSRPDRPTRLPLHPDVPSIANGLSPETGGTLKVLNYAEYLSPDVIKKFGDEHGVTVEITTFVTQDEAIAKLRTAGVGFDVLFPTPDVIGRVVAAKLLQPLNHSYLPNLGNAWPQLRDPFYDSGSRYSVPYNAYTTGIGYRADRVTAVPTRGYDLLWDAAHQGKTYVLDDDREVLAMAMLRAGQPRPEHRGPCRYRGRGHRTGRPDRCGQRQGWHHRLPASARGPGHGAPVLVRRHRQRPVLPARRGGDRRSGFLVSRPTVRGVVGTDTMAIPRSAAKPVLAHLFLNHLLDSDGSVGELLRSPDTNPHCRRLLLRRWSPTSTSPSISPAPSSRRRTTPTAPSCCSSRPAGEGIWEDAWATFKAGR